MFSRDRPSTDKLLGVGPLLASDKRILINAKVHNVIAKYSTQLPSTAVAITGGHS